MKRFKNNELVKKYMWLMLRSIPIIPAPELYDLVEAINRSNRDIDTKIETAYKSLKETSDLIASLETELVTRTEKVTKLKDEYEKYSELAKIEEKEAKALVRQLEETFSHGKKREFVVSAIINLACGFAIFLIGIWLGPMITSYFGA